MAISSDHSMSAWSTASVGEPRRVCGPDAQHPPWDACASRPGACQKPAAPGCIVHRICRSDFDARGSRTHGFRRRRSVRSSPSICEPECLSGRNLFRCAYRKPFQPRFRLRQQEYHEICTRVYQSHIYFITNLSYKNFPHSMPQPGPKMHSGRGQSSQRMRPRRVTTSRNPRDRDRSSCHYWVAWGWWMSQSWVSRCPSATSSNETSFSICSRESLAKSSLAEAKLIHMYAIAVFPGTPWPVA